MAYDGIGSKIMIHKVTDFAKETSNLQKSGELAQSHIQNRAAADTARAREQVQDVYEPSETVIKREQERRKRNGQWERKPAARRTADGKEQPKQLSVPGEGSRIDIKI